MLNPGVQVVEWIVHSALPGRCQPIPEMLAGPGPGGPGMDAVPLVPAGPDEKISVA